MLLAVTYYNKVFNKKTAQRNYPRSAKWKKERELMRGWNAEEGNQIFHIKGDSLFSNGYKW